jgi:hypothetical protein
MVTRSIERHLGYCLAYKINSLKPNDLHRRRTVGQKIQKLFIQFIHYDGSSYMFRNYIAIFRERS